MLDVLSYYLLVVYFSLRSDFSYITVFVSPNDHLASVSTDHLFVATLKSECFNSLGLLDGSSISNLLFG